MSFAALAARPGTRPDREITRYLANLFPIRVDVADRSSLKPLVRPSIERDAIYAF